MGVGRGLNDKMWGNNPYNEQNLTGFWKRNMTVLRQGQLFGAKKRIEGNILTMAFPLTVY